VEEQHGVSEFDIGRLLLQVFGDGGELFEGGFEVGGDFLGDDFGGGEVGGFFEGVVLEPEDVEVDLVALEEVVVGEGLKRSLSLRAVRFLGL